VVGAASVRGSPIKATPLKDDETFRGAAFTLYSGQALAPLLAAALDDQTSIFVGHAGHEPDPAFAAAVRWLKGSFHFSVILCCI